LARLVHPVCVTDVQVDDAELVALTRVGEVDAFAELLQRHQPSLYAAALAIVRDREAALDAVQDTMLIALTHLDRLRDPQAVGGWLRTVVRNCCLMQMRRSRYETTYADPPLSRQQAGPEEFLDHHALRDEVWTALDALPEDERVTLILRYFTRCDSYGAIAAITGVPVGTVRSRLNRARTRLLDAVTENSRGPHRDQRRLESARRQDWEHFYQQLHACPAPRTYRDLYHGDVTVRDPAATWHGIPSWSDEERSAIALGVTARIAGLAASPALTILEIDFVNPPTWPDHCPPSSTFVHRLDANRSATVDIYYHATPAGPDQRVTV
jgi:RNA polymerase sigma-70 factor (ECF subfamily)